MQKLAPKSAWIRGDSQSHPSAGLLRAYYEDSDKLEERTRVAIEAHLRSCTECAYDVEFLNDLEQTLPAAVSKSPKTNRARRFLPRWLSHPVPAFSLVAAVVCVLIVVVLQIGPDQEKPQTMETGARVHVLRVLTRGQSFAATINRTNPSETVLVALPLSASGRQMDYQFRVRDGAESEEFDTVLDSDLSQQDRITLRLNTALLADGRYFVILTERSRLTPADSTVQRFPFELRTAPK